MHARRRYAALLAFVVLVAGCSRARSPGPESLSRGPRKAGREEIGYASFYAGRHHGKPTASGEAFDKNALTAAHRSLPFGTRLEVTNLENDRSVVVRVNDRGPFVRGRIVDLSLAAAKAVGMTKDGVTRVRLRSLQ
jgi:peptidoglycan lytic transglycosylase